MMVGLFKKNISFTIQQLLRQTIPPTFILRSDRQVHGVYIPYEANGRNLLHEYLVQYNRYKKKRDDIKQKIEKCVKENPQYVNEPDEFGYTPLE